jgi:deoxycytidine triphosphate deaminase
MVLSDVDIKRYIEVGKIKIAPDLPPEQFGSRSVDFRLGNEFNVFEYSRHPISICATYRSARPHRPCSTAWGRQQFMTQ